MLNLCTWPCCVTCTYSVITVNPLEKLTVPLSLSPCYIVLCGDIVTCWKKIRQRLTEKYIQENNFGLQNCIKHCPDVQDLSFNLKQNRSVFQFQRRSHIEVFEIWSGSYMQVLCLRYQVKGFYTPMKSFLVSRKIYLSWQPDNTFFKLLSYMYLTNNNICTCTV